MLRLIVLSLVLAATAAAAAAQTRSARVDSVQPALDLSAAHPMLVLRNTQRSALRTAGIARTSVDHRFAADDVEGSLGFLCGLQSGQTEHGAAAVRATILRAASWAPS